MVEHEKGQPEDAWRLVQDGGKTVWSTWQDVPFGLVHDIYSKIFPIWEGMIEVNPVMVETVKLSGQGSGNKFRCQIKRGTFIRLVEVAGDYAKIESAPECSPRNVVQPLVRLRIPRKAYAPMAWYIRKKSPFDIEQKIHASTGGTAGALFGFSWPLPT